MSNYTAEKPERGLGFLADEVRRSHSFPREEVEAALKRYQDVGAEAVATGDWSTWADQFTEDAIYVEHHFGVLRGRETIRTWIVETMASAAGQSFPVLWHMIDNDLVFIYCPIQYMAPDGGDPYKFTCGTVLCYGGDGLWCYEEDIYNVLEAGRVAELFAQSQAS